MQLHLQNKDLNPQVIWFQGKDVENVSFQVEVKMEHGDNNHCSQSGSCSWCCLGISACRMVLAYSHILLQDQKLGRIQQLWWKTKRTECAAVGGLLKGVLLMVIFLCLQPCAQVFFLVLKSLKNWSGCRRAPETSEEMPYSKRFKEFVRCSPTKEQWELTWLMAVPSSQGTRKSSTC